MPELYTVFGYWEDNGQRYGRFDEADSAVHAELLMQRRAAKENAVFWAAATLRGKFHPVDAAYTRYLDPRDQRNEEIEFEGVDELEGAGTGRGSGRQFLICAATVRASRVRIVLHPHAAGRTRRPGPGRGGAAVKARFEFTCDIDVERYAEAAGIAVAHPPLTSAAVHL